MTSIVSRQPLERVTTLDLALMQRFPRRGLERAARFMSRASSQWGPRSDVFANDLESDDARGACLGGLEVQFSSGSSVTVSPGAMVCANSAPVTEGRPGTWTSPSAIESDDDASGIFDLAFATTLTPSAPIAGALAAPEWWVVYVTPSIAAITETDTARKVFNELTGNFDPASQTKVVAHSLVPQILRGGSGNSLNIAIGALPPGSYAIAWLWVPTGATNLSTAQFFDVRRLTFEDRGPNMIAGTWTAPYVGANMVPFPGKTVFQGNVRARLAGEWLECRTLGMDLQNILEPGATWPTGGSGAIAWLYLCKVQGLVPRLRAVGSTPAGVSTSGTTMSGAIVLSPKPPRLRATGSGTPGKGALRWDMRASSSIILPSNGVLGVGGPWPQFQYLGNTCAMDDAICVGFAVYLVVEGGLPDLIGPYFCDQEGWVTGAGVSSNAATLTSSLAASGLTTSAFQLVATLNTATVNGDVVTLPFDGVRANVRGTMSAFAALAWNAADGHLEYNSNNTGSFYYGHTGQVRASYPGGVSFKTHDAVAGGGTLWNTATATLLGVRLPYGEPLVT